MTNIKKKIYFFIAILISVSHIFSKIEHKSSYPYISGDTFRSLADYILDNDTSFNPLKVQVGSIIFVQIDQLDRFFKSFHPKIRNPYILLTHRCGGEKDDDPIPGCHSVWVNDPKIIAWFSQNIDNPQHPKLYQLPIGLANRVYAHGDIEMINSCINKYRNLNISKKLLYQNFGLTHPERRLVSKLFYKKPYCTSVTTPKNEWNAGIPPEKHLYDLACHKFVLSPRGNGLDCHRTWEALLMGCIPIVKTSPLDKLFEDLPVLIVQNWEDVDEEFLNRKYIEFSYKTYNYEKLFAPYWLDRIKKCKEDAKILYRDN